VGLPFLHVLLLKSLDEGAYTPAEIVAIRASLSRLQGLGVFTSAYVGSSKNLKDLKGKLRVVGL